MTHTPGPWKEYDCDTDGTPDRGQLAGDIWGFGRDGKAAIVARAYYCEDDSEANARLIAAAPELLEACEVASQFFEENDNFTDCGEFPIPGFILDMRIAIAKAAGRRTEL